MFPPDKREFGINLPRHFKELILYQITCTDNKFQRFVRSDIFWILREEGDGPGRPALEQRARKLGVAHQVTFTGALERDAVPDHAAARQAIIERDLTWENNARQIEALAARLKSRST